MNRIGRIYNYLVLTACLLLLITQTANSQVTIGSGLRPVSGSILDLKENDNLGANSERGLSLPKVELSDFEQLYPMFSKDDPYYIANKESIDKAYTGLLVYSLRVTQSDPCDFTISDAKPGLHVWDGKLWVPLVSNDKVNSDDDVTNIVVRNPDVKIFYDERAGKKEPYPCREFGDAGIWMTTNLRATDLPDGTLFVKLKAFDNNPNWSNASTLPQKKVPLYYTPYPGPSTGFDDTWVKKNPLVGYSYNYRAIIASNYPIPPSPLPHQGICPTGWHVPTQTEWEELRDAILDPKHVSKYLLPDEHGNYPSPHYSGTPDKDPRFTQAFFLKCTPFTGDEANFDVKGNSKSYADGGFSLIATGMSQIDIKENNMNRSNHSIVFFDPDYKEEIWAATTSANHYKTKRNKVILVLSQGYKVQALAWDDILWSYPVRCKKDNNKFDFIH